MTIGERIKERRKEMNLSADELANKLDVSRATVYRYESDEIMKMPAKVIEPLAAALDCSPSYLMGWDEKLSHNKENTSSHIHYKCNENSKNTKSLLECYNLLNDNGKTALITTSELYTKLNDTGISEAIKRIDELTSLKKYSLSSDHTDLPVLNAAHEIPGASEEDKQHDEDIMNDENF